MKTVKIGSTLIGGGNKIAIQSMTNINTAKVDEVVNQINALKDAGCNIVRLSVKDMLDANALKKIKEKTDIPLVADIHFDYKLAIQSIENGIDKVRRKAA